MRSLQELCSISQCARHSKGMLTAEDQSNRSASCHQTLRCPRTATPLWTLDYLRRCRVTLGGHRANIARPGKQLSRTQTWNSRSLTSPSSSLYFACCLASRLIDLSNVFRLNVPGGISVMQMTSDSSLSLADSVWESPATSPLLRPCVRRPVGIFRLESPTFVTPPDRSYRADWSGVTLLTNSKIFWVTVSFAASNKCF